MPSQIVLPFICTPYVLYSNVLFLAVPAGFLLNYLSCNPVVAFFMNLLAIAPSARILGWAIDDINIPGRASNSAGTIINNTFR